MASSLVNEILGTGGDVICKPWVAHNGKSFTKAAFKMNLRDLSITRPAGETERVEFGKGTGCLTGYRPGYRPLPQAQPRNAEWIALTAARGPVQAAEASTRRAWTATSIGGL